MTPRIAAAIRAASALSTIDRADNLSELTGFNLMVDCLSPGCARERTFAVADLAPVASVCAPRGW